MNQKHLASENNLKFNDGMDRHDSKKRASNHSILSSIENQPITTYSMSSQSGNTHLLNFCTLICRM